MATKKYLDEDGLLYFWQKITNAFVKKDGNKVLSTNDYTTAEKNKLAGIATGAQVNKIETVQVNGSALTITNKTVNIGVPTKHSELTNDNNTVTDANYVHTDNNFTTEEKNKLANTNVAWGTSITGASTAAKEITITGNTNWTLSAGSIIAVKFSATNTAANPTFNVNGTGAKNVWYNTALITTGNLGYAGTANRPIYYVYDGTQYCFLGWSIDNNTTYTNASLGQGYGTCATVEATTEKAVTLSSYSLIVGGIISVKFTYAVPANATMNVNTKGAKAIYWKGAAISNGVIKAGDTATFIYGSDGYYHLISIDRNIAEATTSRDGYMTSTMVTKLNGIATGAQANVIESIKVNGITQTISSKSVNITVPTNNNELANGANYQTEDQVEQLISDALNNFSGLKYELVIGGLPTEGEEGTIYLVSNSQTESQNIYDEYLWIFSKWEKIGTTAVDLSGYVKDSDLVKITNAEIDTIVAS